MKKTTVMKKFTAEALRTAITENGYPKELVVELVTKSELADLYMDLITPLDNGLLSKNQIVATMDSNALVEVLSYNKINFPDGADHVKLASIFFVNQETINERKHNNPPTDDHDDAEKAVKDAVNNGGNDSDTEEKTKAKEKTMKAKDKNTKPASSKKGSSSKSSSKALGFKKADIMNMEKSSIPRGEKLDQLKDAMARLSFKVDDIDKWTSWPTMKIFASVMNVDSFGKKKAVVVKGLKRVLKKTAKKSN